MNIRSISDVKIENNQARFCFVYQGKTYRIFQYFSQQDGGLCFQDYFPGKRFRVANLSNKKRTIKVSEQSQKAEFFNPNKTSFHSSGYINIKDNEGNRPNNFIDIKSKAFKDIDGSLRLLFMYPTIATKYPSQKQGKVYNYFELTDPFMPPQVNIYVSNKSHDIKTRLNRFLSDYQCIKDEETLSQFNLNLHTVLKKSNNPHHPKKASVVGMERY